VPPFVKFSGDPNEVRGVNEEGLKRNGFTSDDIDAVKQAFRMLYRKEKNIAAGLEAVQQQDSLNPHVAYLVEFVRQSCENRFGRYLENYRKDSADHRQRRDPDEVRDK
jgi:UDP-N-acetylglucosamine acyltransferase